MASRTRRGGSPASRPPLPSTVLWVLLATASLLASGGILHIGRVDTGPRAAATSPAHPAIFATSGPHAEHPAIAASPVWVNVTPTGAAPNPPAAAGGSMAYDPVDHATIYFGGCGTTQCPNNQTWSFAGGRWTNLTDLFHAPPARYGATMDYDPNVQGLLLFGGHSASGGYLNDTWLFSGGAWSNLTYVSPTAPPPREYASMAFDPAPEENGSVLFGGGIYGVGPANDTWIWEGWSGWSFLNTSVSPPTTELAGMAYDPTIQALVLFGCGDGCVNGNNETWELYSGQWWQVLPPPPVPVYRYGAALSWDPQLNEILLFGGYSFTGYLSDTWGFTGGRWTQLTTLATPPPGRYSPAMSTNASGAPPVLFGGSRYWPYDLLDRNDTWVLEVPPTASLTLPAAAEALTSVNFTLGVLSGAAPYRALFSFGDGGSTLAVGAGPRIFLSHVYLAPGTYYPFVTVTDSAGAITYAGAAAGSGFLVTPGPALGPVVSPPATDVNISVPLTGSAATAGQGPYTYLWSFGDGATAAGLAVTHAYALPGAYVGNLTATDANGVSATTSFTAMIHPLPMISVAASPAPATAGSPATFYGNVSGGTPPFAYAWTFGDGGTSALPFPTHNYSARGNYTVQLTVTDSVGAVTHQSMTEAVRPASPPTSTPSTNATGASAGVPIWFWPGVGAVLAVGAIGAVLLLRRGSPKPGH